MAKIKCKEIVKDGCGVSMCSGRCLTKAPSGTDAVVKFAVPVKGNDNQPVIGGVDFPHPAWKKPVDEYWEKLIDNAKLVKVDQTNKELHVV